MLPLVSWAATAWGPAGPRPHTPLVATLWGSLRLLKQQTLSHCTVFTQDCSTCFKLYFPDCSIKTPSWLLWEASSSVQTIHIQISTTIYSQLTIHTAEQTCRRCDTAVQDPNPGSLSWESETLAMFISLKQLVPGCVSLTRVWWQMFGLTAAVSRRHFSLTRVCRHEMGVDSSQNEVMAADGRHEMIAVSVYQPMPL